MNRLGFNFISAAFFSILFLAIGGSLIGKAGLGHDEGWHAETTIAMIKPDAAVPLSFWPSMPWMRDSYNGALKTYVLYPPFRLFGISVRTLRWTTLSLGALSLLFITMLIQRLYGTYLGVLFGLIFATDPALILAACFDTGPAILMVFLKLCGFWFLAGWWYGKGEPIRLFAAGLLLGLGLSDKSHFLWVLAALPLCAVFIPWKKLRPRLTAQWRAGLAGILLGAAPFIIYNLRNPLSTLKTPGVVGNPLDHFGRLAEVVGPRWWSLQMALTGSGQWIAGTSPPEIISRPLRIGAWLMAVLLLLCAWRKGWASLRHVWFWLSLSLMIFWAACLSPVPVKWHHFYTIYPFPHLALVALIFQAMKLYRTLGRFRNLWLLPLCGICVYGHWILIGSFQRDLDRTGGSLQFYRGIALVSQWLEKFSKENPETHIFADDGFQSRLSVYSQGKLKLANLPPGPQNLPLKPAHVENCLRLLKAPDSVILLHIPAEGREVFTSVEAIRFLQIPMSPIETFFLADGRPWAGIYRLQSPVMTSFMRSREALRRGKEKEGRRLVLEGLKRWETVLARLARIKSSWSLMSLLDEMSAEMPIKERLVFLATITALSKNQRDIQEIGWELDRALISAASPGPTSRRSGAREQEAPWKEQELEALNLQERKDYDKAIGIWNQLIRQYPHSGKLFSDRGLCEYFRGSSDKAILDLRRAIELSPGLAPSYLTLAAIYVERKQYGAALEIYDLALGRLPSTPENTGVRDMLRHDREEALRRTYE